MTDLKVLGRTTSGNVMKVMWTLAELDLPYVREDIGGKYGGNDTPDYLALNPNGLIPTLIDGGVALWESNTICRYLCNKSGDTSLYPAAPAARALCERWMDWQLSTLSVHTGAYWRMSMRTPKAQQDPAAIAAARDTIAKVLGILERNLGLQPYVAGAHVTLADVAFGFWGHRWFSLSLDQGGFPNMRAWYERLKTRPGFQTSTVQIPIE